MKHLAPIGKATAEELKAACEAQTSKNSPQRRQLFRGTEFNRLYMLNHQWLEDAIGGEGVIGANGVYQSPFLQPVVDSDGLAPRPVHNEILPVVQNEVARMLLSGSQPTVPAKDSGPAIKEAAKLAQDVLRAKDAEINFNGLKRRFIRNQTVDGLGLYISEQQTDYGKTIRQPKSVLGCTSCRWTVSVEDHETTDDGIPIIEGMSAVSAARRGASPINFRMSNFGAFNLGDAQPQAAATVCPECGGQLMARDAQSSERADYADNPLHKDIPLGDIFTGVMPQMDWFPSGHGRVDPDGIVRKWASEEIVSLDFLSQFYEDGYKVKGDDEELRRLARWHPAGFEDGTYVIDAETQDFENQAVLRRLVRLPYFETDDKGNRKYYDRGRFTVMAGNVILIDDHLMLRDDRSGDFIPRCKVHMAPWEPIDGSVWGVALVTYLRSPQDNENTAFAQAIEARHDFGSPKMWLRPGQNIEYLGQSYGGSSNSVFRWIGGTEPPMMRDGTALNEQWKAEVQEYKEAIQRIASSRDVEQGNAPNGVTAAAALRLLSEAATVTRGPRIAATNAAVASLDKHRLQLMGILYKEPRDFKAGGRGDRYSIQAFTGLDLMGQCDVEVNIQPFVESAALKAQATSEALENQTLVLRTAGDRARYLEAQGVPPDIAPGDGLQVQVATDEWLKFVRHKDENGETHLSFGEPPVVKPDFDIDEIHAEQHTIDMMSWEGKKLRENWSKIQPFIFGWQKTYSYLVAGEAMLQVAPPSATAPEVDLAINPIDKSVNGALLETQMREWQQKRDIQKLLETMPKLPELRIEKIWLDMLDAGGYQLAEVDGPFLRFLAHIQSHKANIKEAMAAASPQAPQSPGAPAPGPAQAAPGMVA